MPLGIEIDAREQRILIDKWTADIRFNPFQNFWFYDLYDGDTLLLAGQKLEINAYPLPLNHLPYPKLFLIDTDPNNVSPPDVMTDFGGRLELAQTDYVEAV